MITLPHPYPYTPNKLPMPRNRDNLLVLAALDKGAKLFGSHDFIQEIPGREDSAHRYLRMSQIGTCARQQWFWIHDQENMELNQFIPSYPSEGKSALNIGNVLEGYVVQLLRLGGLEVSDEQGGVDDLNRVISGHIDGILTVNKTRHLLELKALNLNSASKILQQGLAKGSPAYYGQMQYYMQCLELTTGYFIAFVKDSGQFYVELISEDTEYQKLLRQRAIVIANTTDVELIPEKHVVRDCNFCPAKEVCSKLDGGDDEFVRKFREYHHI